MMLNPKRILSVVCGLGLLLALPGLLASASIPTVTGPAATATPAARVYLPYLSRPPGLLLYASSNLSGHGVSAECNPGGVSSCPCSDQDAMLIPAVGFGEVTSNPHQIGTYVNAIGHKKFIETFPNGDGLSLGIYSYAGQVSLPVLPSANISQTANPQAVHLMIQFWDGRNALFPANQKTREGVIFWELNPWTADYGKIKVYVNPVALMDTGITVTPDLNWHHFELTVDLTTQRYVGIRFDGATRDLSQLELARVHQPTWGTEVALIVTTESMATWPSAGCPYAFTWTTRFRDLEFRRLAP
ncbi:MAG: hypothetical protein KA765_11805 [Thermoflexales bacterium]|nr:hypothetical protein [Thermoflexales bacterium]